MPLPIFRKLTADRSGATAIMIALMAAIIIAFAGLGVEVVMALQTQRNMQLAADSSVLAAVTANKVGYPTDYTQEAYGVAAKAGYAHGASDSCDATPSTVFVQTPPCAPFANLTGDVGVRIRRPFPLRLARLVFPSNFTLQVDAVAHWVGKSGCILALSTTKSPSLQVAGTATANVQECDTYVNSASPNAVKVNGGGTFTCDSAGGYSLNIQGTTTTPGGGTINCTTNTAQPPTSDPYAAIPTPSPTSPCTAQPGGSVGTLNPGAGGVITLCNGLSLTNGNTLNLCPGVYIVTKTGNNAVKVTGGTFRSIDTTNANFSTLCPNNTGNGVAIVLTNSTASNTGSVSISGGTITLTGLQHSADGLPAGIVFWQNQGAAMDNTDNVAGGTGSQINGVMYFPQGDLTFAGNTAGSGACTEMIAQTINYTGTSGLQNTGCPQNTIDFGGAPTLIE